MVNATAVKFSGDAVTSGDGLFKAADLTRTAITTDLPSGPEIRRHPHRIAELALRFDLSD
jgi:hypothetical protein